MIKVDLAGYQFLHGRNVNITANIYSEQCGKQTNVKRRHLWRSVLEV